MEIYTDGACSGNPGPGGWAFVLVAEGNVISRGSGGASQTTNNQMELTACIKALESVKGSQESFTLHSDSEYTVKAINEWHKGWIRRGWKNSKGDPVKNQDLIKTILRLNADLDVRWKWIKAHNGDQFNEMVDTMAVEAADLYK